MKQLLCLSLLLFSSLSVASEPLRFGLVGAAAKQTLTEIWEPLLADLGEAIGRPVIPVLFDDYGSGVWYYNSGKVDIGWSGNRMAIELVDNAQAEIFIQVLNSQGLPGYHSHLIVHKDSPYQSVEDIFADASDITFGFGDRKSTSGTLVPMYYLFTKHDRSHFMFNRIKHSNHEQNFHAVADKELEVATVASVMLERFSKRFEDKLNKTRIIWSSPLIPTDALLKRKGLDAELSEMVEQFFLQYGLKRAGKSDEQLVHEVSILRQIKWSGFQASDNSQLDTIRQLNLANRIQSVANDPNIPSNMKKARIQALKNKLKLYDTEP